MQVSASYPQLDVVELTARLMEIESTSGSEANVIDWVHALLAGRDWQVQRIPVSAGRDDLYAVAGESPAITLSTHLDTVPPYIPPRLDGSTLWGRGACDAKGIAAAMIVAGERLRHRGVSVGLLFVIGEEVSHDGARAANEWAATRGTSSRILINGEPTESTLAVGTKGAVRVVVRVEGQAAHSAYPHLGRSATRELVRLLAELDSLTLPYDDLLGDTTINIGSLSGGVADNVVAPWAEARLMARLVTPVEALMPILEEWARGRAELQWGVMVPPVRLGVASGFPTSVAAFATDIPALTNWGTPYLYGPGSIHAAHRSDEYIAVDELRSAVEAYESLVVSVLK